MYSLYKILGVDPKASPEELKVAFRKKAMEYHPDRNHGNDAAAEHFRQVNDAWVILGDADKRRHYDLVDDFILPDRLEQAAQTLLVALFLEAADLIVAEGHSQQTYAAVDPICYVYSKLGAKLYNIPYRAQTDRVACDRYTALLAGLRFCGQPATSSPIGRALQERVYFHEHPGSAERDRLLYTKAYELLHAYSYIVTKVPIASTKMLSSNAFGGKLGI